MNRYYEVLQSHLLFARVGDAGVTEAAVPANDSPAWLQCGNCPGGVSLSVDVQTKDRMQVVLGQRVPAKPIEVGRTVKAKIPLEEMNKLLMDLFFRSDTSTGDDFVSSGSQETVGWLRLQSYNNSDVNRVLLQGLAYVKPSGDLPMGGEDLVKMEFEAVFIGRVSGTMVGAYPV